jgi:hypothetical protein
MAGEFLANANRNDPNLVDKYRTYSRKFAEEQQQINETSRW